MLSGARRRLGRFGADLIWQRGFAQLPPEVAMRTVYEVLFDHPPDAAAFEVILPQLRSGAMSNRDLLELAGTWPEYRHRPPFSEHHAQLSLHLSRCDFIRALPRASRIVDLGGVDLNDPQGALVTLGYPYDFESLLIVDLPSEERHPRYQNAEARGTVPTARGPVTYLYRSMSDLEGVDDASIDLVYSGQSIEHVDAEEGRRTLSEVVRVLRPGGSLALDTPNGRVTRLQQDDFIDPDHEIEYTWPQLRSVIEAAGLTVSWAKGLNYAGVSLAAGTFDMAEVAANRGLYDAVEDCYLLAVVAVKP